MWLSRITEAADTAAAVATAGGGSGFGGDSGMSFEIVRKGDGSVRKLSAQQAATCEHLGNGRGRVLRAPLAQQQTQCRGRSAHR
jgi:hypothetical protein